MASKPAELPISAWAPPSSPLRIEYSTEVMEEIRARAVEGFYRLTRGGVEIAGLLLGAVQRDSIRILSQLPLEIEYAYGPVFSLSPRDLSYIRKILEGLSTPETAENEGVPMYRALGFYVSHSRSGMALTETELDLLGQLFPHTWQTALLLKPSRSPEMAAAFFVREKDGELRASEPHDQFVITPAMGERRARPPRTADPSLQALVDAARKGDQPNHARDAVSGDPATESVASASAAPLARPPRAAPPPTYLHEARLRAMQRAAEEAPAPGSGEAASKARNASSQEDALARRALASPLPAPPSRPPEDLVPQEHAAEPPAASGFAPTAPGEGNVASAAEAPAIPAPPPPLPKALAAALDSPSPLLRESVPERQTAPEHKAPEQTEPETELSTSLQVEHALPRWDEEEVDSAGLRATSWVRWAIPALGLALLLILGYLVYHAFNTVPPTVVFYTRDAGNRLEVVWQLKGLSDARSAVISIRNGNDVKRIDLIRTGQLSGVFSDPAIRRESEIALDVERSSGEAIHRSAPLIASDSVVAQLDDRPSEDATTAASGPQQTPIDQAEPPPSKDLSLSVLSKEPILATPVEKAKPEEAKPPATPTPQPAQATKATPNNEPTSRQPTAREQLNQRSNAPPTGSTPAASSSSSARNTVLNTSPEAPVQARVTEAPPARPGPTPRIAAGAVTRPPVPVPAPSRDVPQQGQAGPAGGSQAVQGPPPAAGTQNIRTQPPSVSDRPPAAPAPRIAAGRVIWTGQLRKNQSLQIAGKGANQGVVNTTLPGKPIRINVLPGELTPQGLIVYTANPKYRNPENAVEQPGPTNGWNQTRYRYDPARANSLIVTAIPNPTNDWQGITVRNDDKNTNVIVIDWQVVEP